MKRKALSLLIALSLSVTMLPFTTFAEEMEELDVTAAECDEILEEESAENSTQGESIEEIIEEELEAVEMLQLASYNSGSLKTINKPVVFEKNGSVWCSWDAVEGATHYKLFFKPRKETSNEQMIPSNWGVTPTMVTGTEFDLGQYIQEGEYETGSYLIGVMACNSEEDIAYSSTLYYTVEREKITNFTTYQENNRTKCKWNAVSDAAYYVVSVYIPEDANTYHMQVHFVFKEMSASTDLNIEELCISKGYSSSYYALKVRAYNSSDILIAESDYVGYNYIRPETTPTTPGYAPLQAMQLRMRAVTVPEAGKKIWAGGYPMPDNMDQFQWWSAPVWKNVTDNVVYDWDPNSDVVFEPGKQYALIGTIQPHSTTVDMGTYFMPVSWWFFDKANLVSFNPGTEEEWRLMLDHTGTCGAAYATDGKIAVESFETSEVSDKLMSFTIVFPSIPETVSEYSPEVSKPVFTPEPGVYLDRVEIKTKCTDDMLVITSVSPNYASDPELYDARVIDCKKDEGSWVSTYFDSIKVKARGYRIENDVVYYGDIIEAEYTVLKTEECNDLYVVSGPLNVRDYPITGERIGGLSNGDVIHAKKKAGDWILFDYNGKEAWVYSGLLNLTYSEDTAINPVYYTLKVNTINVREDISTTSNRIGGLNSSDRILVTGKRTDANGDEWLVIDYNGQLGYVLASLLEAEGASEQESAEVNESEEQIEVSFPENISPTGTKKMLIASGKNAEVDNDALTENEDGSLEFTVFPSDGKNFNEIDETSITLPEGLEYVINSVVANADGSITVRLSKKTAQEPETPVYTIIKGDGQTYTKESGKTLEFTCDGAYDENFLGIKIDSAEIDAANYDVKSGSTIVTLKNAYLETLAEGDHTIQYVYKEATSNTAKFTIAKASEEGGDDPTDPTNPTDPKDPKDPIEPSKPGDNTKPSDGNKTDNTTKPSANTAPNSVKSPSTGDNSHLALWMSLMVVSCIGIAGSTVFGKRRRNHK